jgi:sugar-specific transcriptional regulator TrmB
MNNIDLLKNLGFTEYEARIYVVLSELGPSNAKELSNYSKIPKNKTYETLNNLEKKKKILTLPVTPKKYKILDINQLAEEIDIQKNSLKILEKTLANFIEESKKPKNEFKEIFWIIRGKDAIIKKMSLQNKICKKEILSINRLSSSNPVNLRNMKHAINNGSKIKMLVPINKDNKEHVLKWGKIGVKIKKYDEAKYGPIGTRMGVFDNNVVRITFGEPDVKHPDDYITLWAESPHFARIIKNYFMNIWDEIK